jgi:hypothetical protein
MDDESKKLFQENLEVSRESLKILKKINRDRIFGRIYGFLKFIVIVALTLGSFLYVEPYLTAMFNTLNKISSGVSEVQKTSQALNPANLNLSPDLMTKIKSLLGQ